MCETIGFSKSYFKKKAHVIKLEDLGVVVG